ncbi:hypothetical protein WA026_003352 [Henosepilachna vigintioctopunctata]|uniref:Uncharacterized protein n=1 Tax=Henosepilachna vigintioctopunctata TaxID=420089 RepID=A0AAW1TJD4_9CUCU
MSQELTRRLWMIVRQIFINSFKPRQISGTSKGTDHFGNKYYEIPRNASVGQQRTSLWYDSPVKDDFMQEVPLNGKLGFEVVDVNLQMRKSCVYISTYLPRFILCEYIMSEKFIINSANLWKKFIPPIHERRDGVFPTKCNRNIRDINQMLSPPGED